ncbi:MAG TPA: flagellar hook-associated protein FlgK [Myxococcota bacterium]|jgi:flagellar hook-associated protein 1 FlgK|nr:flagellar hook-associated protein FlgK [Myxococcota bacterium]
MSGLFGVLNLSARALAVVQGGIRTTSHNVANVNTPGYSRQRQVLEAGRPIPSGEGQIGTGVEQRTIDRVTDGFVQHELVQQGASVGSTDVEARTLSQIEEVLNEQGGPGLTASLSQLYDGFQDLATASAAGQPSERAAVRAAASSLVDGIHQADTRLRSLQKANDRAIVDALPEINSLAERISALNQDIRRIEVQAPANDLRDEREQLVRELAGKVDVTTFEQNDGAVVVTLSNGLPLVEGLHARTLQAQADPTNPFDPTFSKVYYDDGTNQLDVTAQIGGGELGGLLRSRDSLIPAAIRSLDTIAYNLASSVNAVHAAGVGLDGLSGDFFAAPAAVADAARDLALDPRILASTDAIAAGTTAGATDNRNALALAALRTTAAPIYLPGDAPGSPSGPARSVLDHAASVVADVGEQSRSAAQARDQQSRVMEGLENRRDAVSAVSLDEEMTDLIRLQAAFQANAKVVSAVDRMLQDVLSML